MSAREDYAKLDALTSGPHHQGQMSTEAQAALDEIDQLRRWKAEALPLLAVLERCHDQLPAHWQARLGEQKADAVENYLRTTAR